MKWSINSKVNNVKRNERAEEFPPFPLLLKKLNLNLYPARHIVMQRRLSVRLANSKKIVWLIAGILAVFIFSASIHYIFEGQIRVCFKGECPFCNFISSVGNSGAGLRSVFLLFVILLFLNSISQESNCFCRQISFNYSSQAPPLS